MSKLNKVLLVVFVLQSALVIFLTGSASSLSVVNKAEPLTAMTLSEISEFKINDKNASITVSKQGGQWILPETKNFPVESSKVEEIIGDVLKIKTSFPVGTSKAASKQFRTDSDEFEKKLILKKSDGKEFVYYFGKSPAFRQVYVRRDGSEETFPVEYENYRLSLDVNGWFSRSLLKVNEKDLESFKLKDLEIVKSGTGFTLSDIRENEEIKSEGMESFLKEVTGISYSELPVSDRPADFDLLPEVLKYNLKVKGELQEIIIKGPIKKNEESEPELYYAKSSASDFYFKVDKSAFDLFLNLGRGIFAAEKLVSEMPAEGQ